MAFREQSAWWMMAVWAAVLAWYLWAMAPWQWTLASVSAPLKPVIWVTGLQVIGAVIVQAVLAGRRPDEAGQPADERERPLVDRARSWSGMVLSLGCVLALLHYLQHGHGDLLFHTIFLSLLVAAIAEYGFVLFLFRRGA